MHKDNQQQTVSDFELGWLAGFLEGEGSICLQIHERESHRKQNLRVTPKIIFTNTDIGMIERCVNILDRLGIGKWVHHTNPRNNPNGLVKKSSKMIHYVHVSGYERLYKLLSIFEGKLGGEKNLRCIRLLALVKRRIERCESLQMGKNLSYDETDIALMLDFMKLTASPNYDHVARMLNEYTQGRRADARFKMDSELGGNVKKSAEMTGSPSNRICTAPGCHRKHYALGLCSRHWQQARSTSNRL